MIMGLPKVITTDQGSEFKNALNTELMRALKIKHNLTTPYHPQANGLDERFNQTLQEMLVKVCNGAKELWDEHLDSCTFAYNTSRQESTLYTPFEIMFGRKAVLPIDIDENGPCVPIDISDEDTRQSLECMTNNRIRVLNEVKENIIKAQQKQREVYNRKHSNPSKFVIGTSVLKKDFMRKKRKGGKLDHKWLGPYVIAKDLGRGFYALSEGENVIVKRVNGAHLKIYHSQPVDEKNHNLTINDLSEELQNSSLDNMEVPKNGSCRWNTSIEDSIAPLPPPITENKYLELSITKPTTEILQPPMPKPRKIFKPAVQAPSRTITPQPLPPKPKPRTILKPAVQAPSRTITPQPLPPKPKPRTILKPAVQAPSRTITPQPLPPKPKPRTIFKLAVQAPSRAITPQPLDSFSTEVVELDQSITCSTMNVEGGYFPSFFPNHGNNIPSPITKKEEQAKNSTDKNNRRKLVNTKVKNLAFKQRQQKVAKKNNKVSVIDLDKVASPKMKVTQPTSRDSVYTDRNILLNGGWLTDYLINAGQNLLKKCFHTNGFQDVSLGQTLAFDVMGCQDFIQVLNTGRHHWVTITNIGCQSGEIDIFDSMYPTLTNSLQLQIASLLCTKETVVTVKYRQCQLQNGATDCGLFALAFASVIASGAHPSAYQFNQSLMRQHLDDCIVKDAYTPFPVKKVGRNNRKRVRLTEDIPIWCSCRMPTIFSKEMIMCAVCRMWFHLDLCVPLSANTQKKWLCSQCQDAN
jgi:hypothetical protein